MAEFAEAHIQSTVAEIEEIERIGLLSKAEISALIGKRKEFQYRLAKRFKSKDDNVNYFNYEKKLLELLWIRRENVCIIYEKKKEIEGAIHNRLIQHLRYMTRYWPHHHDTWNLRISFAHSIFWKSEVSAAYAEKARYHGNNPNEWVSWAKYEVEERGNFDEARKILLSRGGAHHSKSPVIKREHFRLELLFVESLKKKVEEKKAITEILADKLEKILKGDIPRLVYKDAVKNVPDPELYVDMYRIANKFSFAAHIRDEIYKDLTASFPNSEWTWRLKAQRMVIGLDPITTKDGEVKRAQALLALDKLKAVTSIYDEALEAVGPSFFSSYIEELMLMLRDCWSLARMREFILEKMVDLFKSNKSLLKPSHYIIWFQIEQKVSDSCEAEDAVMEEATKAVMEEAMKAYPQDVAPLHLESFRRMLLLSDKMVEDKLKCFENKLKKLDSIADKAKGRLGIEIFSMLIGNLKENKQIMSQYQRASEHSDDAVAKEFRVRYLQWQKDHKPVKFCRAQYDKYRLRPPFSSKLHALMVLCELTKKKSDVGKAHEALESAVSLFGSTLPGLWLVYICFEKSKGNPLNTGSLYTRAETELKTEYAEVFRELNASILEMESTKLLAKKKVKTAEELQKRKEPKEGNKEEENVWVLGRDTKEEGCEDEEQKQKSAAVNFFDEELTVTYNDNEKRKKFFSAISDMEKFEEAVKQPISLQDDGSEWEEVLKFLTGKNLSLSIQKVPQKLSSKSNEDFFPTNASNFRKKKDEKKYDLSDRLNTETGITMKSVKTEVEKLLETSETLKPEFLQQTQLSPYYVGKKRAKALRKNESEKTKGAGWNGMRAPELTEELKRDLDVLKMRSILDPKRPFKNKDLKVMPKYFQMGKYEDSPGDMFSSHIPKKKRKRTMAEEILNDEEALRYQKRKYNEIIAAKETKIRRSAFSGEKKDKKRSKEERGRKKSKKIRTFLKSI